jgi:hypothetical protein
VKINGTDPGNCGGCGVICSNANGTTSCSGGVCQPVCSAGFASCDGNATNGCETSTNSVTNCGSCGNVCSAASGTPNCTAGTCGVASCAAGYGDCDNNASDGCEAPLNTNTNCGGCGVTCSLTNAAATCASGSCQISTCNTGYADCNGDPSDGCETALNTSSNCGACGSTCTNANGTTSCQNGVCKPTCTSGYADCNGIASDGCEASLTSVTSCGNCGDQCATANGTPNCVSGTCGVASCSAGYGDCNGLASDGCEAMLNTNTNCTMCGTACARANASASCSTGSCVLGACNANYGNCDGDDSNGCETHENSTNNCGACGTASGGAATCSNPHGGENCTNPGTGYVCQITFCFGGYADCNSNANDGCETQIHTNSNCNGCGNACTGATTCHNTGCGGGWCCR